MGSGWECWGARHRDPMYDESEGAVERSGCDEKLGGRREGKTVATAVDDERAVLASELPVSASSQENRTTTAPLQLRLRSRRTAARTTSRDFRTGLRLCNPFHPLAARTMARTKESRKGSTRSMKERIALRGREGGEEGTMIRWCMSGRAESAGVVSRSGGGHRRKGRPLLFVSTRIG